jgi:DNA-binding transcriptional MerR regulator
VDDDLVPIGRFARLCRLSVKRLRHYDGVGLLPPAYVDEATGYRYYRRDQARDALTIGLLRALDVPLPAVTEVLSGDPDAVAHALRRRGHARRAGLRGVRGRSGDHRTRPPHRADHRAAAEGVPYLAIDGAGDPHGPSTGRPSRRCTRSRTRYGSRCAAPETRTCTR